MSDKILLVDDNTDLLMITQIILKGQGYEIVIAESIDEAEKKIKIHQPALILLDVFVGEEDGRVFCYQLKGGEEKTSARIILMSGDECMEYNGVPADAFLQKPFDFNELVNKVQQQLAMAG